MFRRALFSFAVFSKQMGCGVSGPRKRTRQLGQRDHTPNKEQKRAHDPATMSQHDYTAQKKTSGGSGSRQDEKGGARQENNMWHTAVAASATETAGRSTRRATKPE